MPGEKEQIRSILAGSRVMKNLWTCRLPALEAHRAADTSLARCSSATGSPVKDRVTRRLLMTS